MPLPLIPLNANTPNRSVSFHVDTKDEPIDSDQPLSSRLGQRAKIPLKTPSVTFVSMGSSQRIKEENSTVTQQRHDEQLLTLKQQFDQTLQEHKKRKQEVLGSAQSQCVCSNNSNSHGVPTSAQSFSNSNYKGRPEHFRFSPDQEQYIANLLAIPRNWALLTPNNAGTSSSDDSLAQEIKAEIRKRLLKTFNARFDVNLTYNHMKAKIWGIINLWRMANKELETSGPSQKDKVLKMCHYFDILSPAISESRKLSSLSPILPHPPRPSPEVYGIAGDGGNEGTDEVMLQGFIQRPKESEPLEKKRRLSQEKNVGASPSKEESARMSSSERKGTRASPSEGMSARACSSEGKGARTSPSDEKRTRASFSGERGARTSSSEGKGTRENPSKEMDTGVSPSDEKGTKASLPVEKGPRSSPSEGKSAGVSSSSGAEASPSSTLQVGMIVQQQQQKDQHHQHHHHSQDWQKRMASEQLKLDEMKVNMLQQALDLDKRMRDLQEQTMVAVLQKTQSEMQRAQAEMQRTLAQATRAQIEVKIVQAEVLKAQAEVQKAQAEARIAEAEEEFRKAQMSSRMANLRSDGLEMVNGYFKV